LIQHCCHRGFDYSGNDAGNYGYSVEYGYNNDDIADSHSHSGSRRDDYNRAADDDGRRAASYLQ